MNRWKDWYEQGKRDYKKALFDLENEFYEWACFTFQQSSEKILKSLGLYMGMEVWTLYTKF